MPLRHDTDFPPREGPHTVSAATTISNADAMMHAAFQASPSFANFIGNSKHHLVLSVLHELVDGSHEAVNPVLLDGPSGTGKTHLLRAVTLSLSPSAPPARPDTLAALTSLLEQQTATTRESLLTRQALIIDDLHVPAPPLIQLQLCDLLDSFIEAGKPVLLAGTGQFAAWSLETALRSRLKAGIILTLPDTDLDLRLRFIQRFSETLTLNLSRETTLAMARQCTDLRELTGLMRRMHVWRRVNGAAMDERELETLLSGSRPDGVLTPQFIVAQVSQHLGVSQNELLGASRTPSSVFARQVAMYLCRSLLGLSYPSLGRIFGGKNHSSVMHAVKKIKVSMIDNKVTHNLVTELTMRCQKRTP